MKYKQEVQITDYIVGGGGSKKPRTPVESANTLQSRSTIRLQELLSEGETVGVVGGLKGVYLDDTVVQNPDGTFNYPAVAYDERTGTLSQVPMEGFPAVEDARGVGVEVDSPLVRTVSAVSVDAVRVIVRLPSGLSSQDMSNGDLKGFRVGFALDVRPVGGSTWTNRLSKIIQGKTMDPYEAAFRIERPVGTGLWEVRMRRTTVKSDKSSDIDRIDWQVMVEIQDVKLSYPEAAYIGLAIDSEATAGLVPKRSYLYDGIICKVPTNYTPTVYRTDGTVESYASYSGTWNGQFKDSWTDDPAWILYDVLTNERYGMGEYMRGASIDIYSFYEASRYNCELIPDGIEGSTALEPRFRMNTVLASREDAFRVIQTLAASFRSILVSAPGTIKLLQDRPTPVSATVNNSTVIDGMFSYVGTDVASRLTAVDVTYNNANDGYKPDTVTWEASEADMQRYGFNKQELTAMGVVHQGQATRLAKWAIESSLTATKVVTFAVGPRNLFMDVGDIINVADELYADTQFTGLLVAIPGGNANQIRFDRKMTLSSGTLIRYTDFVGNEHTRRVIVSGTNTDTFSLAPAGGGVNPNAFPNAPYIVVGPIAPRQFKVTGIREQEMGKYEVTAAEHDPTKYARIEQGVYVDPPVFTSITGWTVGRPGPISVSQESYITPQNVVRYRLRFNMPPIPVEQQDNMLRGYRMQWRRDNGPFQWTAESLIPEITLDDAIPGVYEYNVFAYNVRGVQSPARSDYYILEVGSADTSPAAAPSNVRLVDGGNTFNGTNFTVTWDVSVPNVLATVRDYQVVVKDGPSAAAPVVHTAYVTGNTFTIDRAQVLAWTGRQQPGRNLFVEVRTRDTFERLSNAAVAAFNNPAPAPLANVNAVPFTNYYLVEHTQPVAVDLVGIKIHHSLTPGFEPTRNNLVSDDVGTSHLITGEPDTTYYYRIAAYDSWSSDELELNYSPQQNVTTTTESIGIIPVPPGNLAAASAIVETSAGNQQARVDVTWTKSTNTDMYDLEILAPPIGVADYPVVTQPESGTTVKYTFFGVPAVVYRFRVRSRAATNVSEWSAAVSHTAAADTVAPASPTGLLVTGGFGSIALKWVNPTASDLAGIQVYRRRATAPAGPEELVTTVPAPLTAYFDSGLLIGITYHYRLRAVDRSGNLSPFTAEAGALVGGLPNGSVDSASLADNSITMAKLATGLQPIEIVSSLPTTGNFVGRTVFLTTDNKLYRRTANAWTAAVPTSDLTGQITGVQITDNAVTAAKIAANTITASEINAASLRTAILIANSITTGMLQAGSVTASQIATNSIVASKMAIGDWSNIVPDPEIMDDNSWSLPPNFSFVQQTNTNLGMRSQRVILYTKPAGATGYTPAVGSRWFSVEPNAQYYVSLQSASTSNASHNVLYRLVWQDSSGNLTGPYGYTDVADVNAPGSGTQTTGRQITAPPGAVRAAMYIYVQQSATNTAGIWIGGPVVRRASSGELIVDGAITTDKLFANAVTAAKIAANTITANEINAGSVRAAVLVANSISTDMLQANAVNANKIDANSIRAAILVANSITSAMIQANQITAHHVGANTIVTNSANIADAVIINAKIQNGAIENAKIANGAVTNLKISGLLSSDNYIYNVQGWGFNKNDGSLSLNGNVPGQGRNQIDNNGIQLFDGSGNLRMKFTIN